VNIQTSIAVNFILFQIGWFACVLMAARDNSFIGVVIGLMIVVVHLILNKFRINNLVLMILVTLLGFSWDSVLTHFNVLVFNTGIMLPDLAPSWILVMWILFSTTLNISFRWLYGRYTLAMLLGAIFGPIAYQAGSALGAVEIPDDLMANGLMALGWSLLMPLFIKLAELTEGIEAERSPS